ncbi:MAG: MFS transporter, partial [SAR202 cluster bacterium]|nr:MFS transporter [SAR202 cluster bacterium]
MVKLAPGPDESSVAPPAAEFAPEPKRRFFGIGGTTFESLAMRDFRWLFASSVSSFMAMNMQMIARVWLVLRLANDSPFAVAYITAAFAIPMLLVSAVSGALADRIPRRRMMILAQTGNAVVALVIGILDATNLIAIQHLIGSGILSGAMMAFNMPSRQAIISEIVPEDKLMNGIALQSSGMNMTRIVGPAAAGFLIILIDTAGVFFIVSALYFASVLTVAVIDAGKTAKSRSEKSVVGDIGAGFKYAAREPILLGLIILAFIPVLFGMSYYVLLPSWAREALNVGAEDLGVLMMTMGIGALAGSLLVASLKGSSNRGILLLGSCISWGIALAVFAQSTSYIVALPLLLFVGLASSVFMSLNMTLLQVHASPEMRGRIMSIGMMTFGFMPLSALPFGILAE